MGATLPVAPRRRFKPVTVRSRCLIVEGGRILVQRDRDGVYALPGGRLEYDETIPFCAVRELREEAGIDVIPERLVYIVEYVGHRKDRFKHEILFIFKCSWKGPLRKKEESIDFEWRRPEELRGSFWPQALLDYMERDHPDYATPRFLVFLEDRLNFTYTLPGDPGCAVRFQPPLTVHEHHDHEEEA